MLLPTLLALGVAAVAVAAEVAAAEVHVAAVAELIMVSHALYAGGERMRTLSRGEATWLGCWMLSGLMGFSTDGPGFTSTQQTFKRCNVSFESNLCRWASVVHGTSSTSVPQEIHGPRNAWFACCFPHAVGSRPKRYHQTERAQAKDER